MVPLDNVIWKNTGGYKFSKSKEKSYHFIYMEDKKMFAKNEKRGRHWYKQ